MSPALPAQPSHRRLQPPPPAPSPLGGQLATRFSPLRPFPGLGRGVHSYSPTWCSTLTSTSHPWWEDTSAPGTRLLPGGHSGRARVSHLPTSAPAPSFSQHLEAARVLSTSPSPLDFAQSGADTLPRYSSPPFLQSSPLCKHWCPSTPHSSTSS